MKEKPKEEAEVLENQAQDISKDEDLANDIAAAQAEDSRRQPRCEQAQWQP